MINEIVHFYRELFNSIFFVFKIATDFIVPTDLRPNRIRSQITNAKLHVQT